MTDLELSQCIAAIPAFVSCLERNLHTNDVNMAQLFALRAEEFIELLRVLTGLINSQVAGCRP